MREVASAPSPSVPVREPKYHGVKHFFAAFRYSVYGFQACFKHESAFRQELFLGLVHVILLSVLPLVLWERLLLVAVWFLVIICELLNSALEAIVDLVSPEWHELAKRAKDMGSATTFSALTLFFLCWAGIAARLLGWWS